MRSISADIAVRPPVVVAGFPLTSWAFAVRIWLALILALYVSFWLQLGSPTSAALTVTILALPTRGQGLEKAGFRLFATAIGVTASIAIVAAFSQTNVLMLLAFAGWFGLCIYFANVLDGNRAYAATLCGTTVALIAIQQIDTPQNVFDAGLERGAAIVVGILSVAVVNDLLAAPDYHPKLLAQIEGLRRKVFDYARSVARGDAVPAASAAALMGEITALRPEVTSLAYESSSGSPRRDAAQTAIVDLVSGVAIARALQRLPHGTAPAWREGLLRSIESVAPEAVQQPLPAGGQDGQTAVAAAPYRFAERLRRKCRALRLGMEALRAGSKPTRVLRALAYRPRSIAVGQAVRSAFYFIATAAALMAAGWPTADIALSLVGILICFGSIAPDPKAFAKAAVLATPIGSVISGLLMFVILDGVDSFPLLAIALAPVVIGLTLLMTLPNPALSAMGRVNLLFVIVLVAPNNPQPYNPQAFLVTVLFLALASLTLFALQLVVPPLTKEAQLRLLLRDQRRRSAAKTPLDEAPEEATFRDAMLVGRMMAAGGGELASRPVIGEAMARFDAEAAMRICRFDLDRLARTEGEHAAVAAREAVERYDRAAILEAAEALRSGTLQANPTAADASASLVLVAAFLANDPDVEASLP